MGFLSDSEKNELSKVFDELHDTWARDVVYYEKPEEIIIETNTNHNFLFGGAPSNTKTQTVQKSGTFKARILWGKKQDENSPDGNVFRLKEGQCRLKVNEEGMEVLNKAERVVIDGIPCRRIDSPRPHGLFDIQYYTYIYQRVE